MTEIAGYALQIELTMLHHQFTWHV